jgi:hypothetical protein
MEPKGQRESLGVFGDVLRVIWIRRRWSSDATDGGPRIAVNGSFKDAFCTFVHADSIWYGHQDAIGSSWACLPDSRSNFWLSDARRQGSAMMSFLGPAPLVQLEGVISPSSEGFFGC